jgi:polyisoprenoid-binding protein YceI
MSDQAVQQALPTGSWSADKIHSTVGVAVPHMAAAPDPYGGERFGLQLEAAVERTKFGLNWNNPLPSGDPALANDVTIIVDLQLTKEA